jgi:hypothetical protein
VRRGRAGRLAGEDEVVVVEGDGVGQPAGAGIGADEHEQRARGQAVPVAGRVVLNDDRAQGSVTDESTGLGFEHDLGVAGGP